MASAVELGTKREKSTNNSRYAQELFGLGRLSVMAEQAFNVQDEILTQGRFPHVSMHDRARQLTQTYTDLREGALNSTPEQMLITFQTLLNKGSATPSEKKFIQFLQTSKAHELLTEMLESYREIDPKALKRARVKLSQKSTDNNSSQSAIPFNSFFQPAVVAEGVGKLPGQTELGNNVTFSTLKDIQKAFEGYVKSVTSLKLEHKAIYGALYAAAIWGLLTSWSAIGDNLESVLNRGSLVSNTGPAIISLLESAVLSGTFRRAIVDTIRGDTPPLRDLWRNKQYGKWTQEVFEIIMATGAVAFVYLGGLYLFRLDVASILKSVGNLDTSALSIPSIWPWTWEVGRFLTDLPNATKLVYAFVGGPGPEILPVAAEWFRRRANNQDAGGDSGADFGDFGFGSAEGDHDNSPAEFEEPADESHQDGGHSKHSNGGPIHF